MVASAVAAVGGVVGALWLLWAVLAPRYLGALAAAFGLDERLRAGADLVAPYAVLTVVFAAPWVLGVALVIGAGARLRRRTPRPGTGRPVVPRWRWVLLAIAGAYTVMVSSAVLSGRTCTVGAGELAERIGQLSADAAGLLQQAAYPSLALLLYSFGFLRFMGWLVRGDARRRAWVYLAGAVVVFAVAAVVAGAGYR